MDNSWRLGWSLFDEKLDAMTVSWLHQYEIGLGEGEVAGAPND
jgi:hypothetical protein